MWGRAGLVAMVCGCTFTPNAGNLPSDATGPGGEPLPADARPGGSDAADPPPDAGPPPDAPVDAPPDAPTLLPCPVSYTLTDANHPGSMYRVETASATWTAAEAACEADEISGVTAPAHLIVLDDQPEGVLAWNHNTSDQWVGHSDRRTEGTWLPVTDQATVFTGNAAGNTPGKDCLMISSSDGQTSADPCTNGHPYVCECDGRRADPDRF